jgi:hypothetical protein
VGDQTVVSADTDGDGSANFQFDLDGLINLSGRKSPGRRSLVDRLVECRVAEANPAALGEQVSSL